MQHDQPSFMWLGVGEKIRLQMLITQIHEHLNRFALF